MGGRLACVLNAPPPKSRRRFDSIIKVLLPAHATAHPKFNFKEGMVSFYSEKVITNSP
jgi:hypothetical protein